jgi:hypothetical protein
LTAPTGTPPAIIAPTCRTISSDRRSIAGGVRPPDMRRRDDVRKLGQLGNGIWSSALADFHRGAGDTIFAQCH